MRSVRRSLLLFIVLAISAVIVAPSQVLANPNIGLDPDDYGPGTNMIAYVVSKDGYTDITATHLKIYSTYDNISVFIDSADFCPDANTVHKVKDFMYGGGTAMAAGTNATSFKLTNGYASSNASYSSITGNGKKRPAAFCNTGDTDPAWPGPGDPVGSTSFSQTTVKLNMTGGATVAGLPNIYKYDLDASWLNAGCSANCGQNSFRVKVYGRSGGVFQDGTTAGKPNTWVSQDPAGNATEFGVNPGLHPDGNFYNLNIYFGPDCSYTSASSSEKITIYDDDNFNANGTQPTSDPFEVFVQRTPRANPDWPNAATVNLNPTSPAGLDRNNKLADDWWRVGTAGSKHDINLNFTVDADFLYRFRVRKLYYNNTLQFQMPFASIYGDPSIQCPVNVSPNLGVSPTGVSAGTTVTADFAIDKTSNTYYKGKVEYQRVFWYNMGSQGAPTDANPYNPGEGDTLVPALAQNNTGWYGPTTVSTPSPPLYSIGTWNTTAPAGYTSVCAALKIRAAAGESQVNINNPDWLIRCTSLSKTPSLQVSSGDLRVGGSFGTGTCTTTMGGAGVVYNKFNIVGHTYTYKAQTIDTKSQYAALGPGYIKAFGTNNVASDVLKFASNAGSGLTGDGLFYGGGLAASTTIPTHCITDVFTGRYTPTVTYNFTGAGQTYTIPAQTLIAGQSVVYRVTNTSNYTGTSVKLSGDIKYNIAAGTAPVNLPQFVLLVQGSATNATTLSADPAVKRLDGIYALSGAMGNHFYTCTGLTGTENISTSTCANQLHVNGAVLLSGGVKPYRTYGHDSNVDATPAEEFKLRPDILLRDYFGDGGGPLTLRIVDQQETSPRY